MSKSLVIVESPAKAKTISKYLGSEYIVESSVGHIRDLPKKASSNTKRSSIPKDLSITQIPQIFQLSISLNCFFQFIIIGICIS